MWSILSICLHHFRVRSVSLLLDNTIACTRILKNKYNEFINVTIVIIRKNEKYVDLAFLKSVITKKKVYKNEL